jgi:hypothetical protein
MSYQFDGGDTQGLYTDTAFVTEVPLWIVVGFTQEAEAGELGTFPMIAVQGVGGSNNNRWSLNMDDSGGLRATSRTASSVQAETSTAISDTSWHVGLAIFESATSRAAELDGGGTGTNTTSNTPVGVNRFVIGLSPTLNALGHEGKIAYVGIGSGTPSAGDRTMLGAGGDPRDVSGATCLELWDLTSDTPLIGLVSATELTVQGSPTVVSDAPDYDWLAANQEAGSPMPASSMGWPWHFFRG